MEKRSGLCTTLAAIAMSEGIGAGRSKFGGESGPRRGHARANSRQANPERRTGQVLRTGEALRATSVHCGIRHPAECSRCGGSGAGGDSESFRNLKQFRAESKFSTWLIQIAVNEARMRRRKEHAEIM